MSRSYTLYTMSTCPFCRHVETFMKKHGIDLPRKDILAEAGARDELISIGGKGQVPCLVIDGKALYESADIIAYMGRSLL